MKIKVFNLICRPLLIDVLEKTIEEAGNTFEKILKKIPSNWDFCLISVKMEEMEEAEYDTLEDIEV